MKRSEKAPAARSSGAFRSLTGHNYRLWMAGAFVSNIGTWMDRTAQHWLVLTQLTSHSASALGILMSLQYAPQLLFLPWIGFAADYFERRKLLKVTQTIMGLLALTIATLTLTGRVELWHVYLIGFLSGTVNAFDAPVRQTFVADLVGDDQLPNAVALSSSSFNIARLVGPAVSGLCIAALGTGWSFLINASSFIFTLGALMLLRKKELHPSPRARRSAANLRDGINYVRNRPDLQAMMFMLFLVGTFGLNYPIFISTMSVTVFHEGAGRYGLLNSMMAVGTISATVLAARRERPRFDLMTISAMLFGIGFVLAMLTPNYWLFGATLVVIGIASLTFTNNSNTLIQLSTEPSMRGRMMALRLAIMVGATPIGAPFVGWVADRFGARWALGVGAFAGFSAMLVGLRYLGRHHDLRWRDKQGRWRLSVLPNDPQALMAAHMAAENDPVAESGKA